MPAKSTNLIISLLLGLFLSILGCNSVTPSTKNESSNSNNLPVKSLKITINVNQSDEYLAQLQKFADKHSLEFTVSFYDAQKTDFFVVIYGNGFEITNSAAPRRKKEIDIHFYNVNLTPTPQKTVDELFTDLKSFIKEIPNVTIAEQIKSLKITTDKGQEHELFTELFTQLQDFADQHSLEFTVSSYDSDLDTFLVEMDGDGFQITSEVPRSGLRKIFVFFYIHYDDNGIPTPTSQEAVDELFSDLKSFFGTIPNVTITEEK